MKFPIDHFSILAPFYEKVIKTDERADFWHLVDIQDGHIILDAGGGTGRVSQGIKKKNCLTVVSDPSFAMVNEARAKVGLTPLCATVEDIPFHEQQFDRVIMVDVLHHVFNQNQSIHEMWRILKPGGRLIIEEPDIHNFWVKLIALGEKVALMRSHFLDSEAIVGLFSTTNAKIQIHRVNANIIICAEKPVTEI